eukprot:6179139-Pleurochrysis_carterae.AAC.2
MHVGRAGRGMHAARREELGELGSHSGVSRSVAALAQKRIERREKIARRRRTGCDHQRARAGTGARCVVCGCKGQQCPRELIAQRVMAAQPSKRACASEAGAPQ